MSTQHKNHSKTFIFIFTACLLFFSNLSAYAEPGADSLWFKTVELADKNRGWIAGETKILIEFLNSKGKVSKTMNIKSTAELTEDNSVSREISGFEEFDKMKNPNNDQQADNNKAPDFLTQQEKYNLFLPEAQENISIKHLDHNVVMGAECAVYDISGKSTEGEEYTAKAWIDEQTGIPLKLQLTFITIPEHLRSMKIDTVFSSADNRNLYPETSILEITAVKFLIFKIRVRWTIKYDKYFRIPEEQ